MANVLASLVDASKFQQQNAQEGMGKIADVFEKQRLNDLGKKFVSMGDYSPQSLQKFAQENSVSMDEMHKLVEVANKFKVYQKDYDPLTAVNQVDPKTGIKTSQLLPESKVAGMGPIVSDVPKPEFMVNPDGSVVSQNPYGPLQKGVTLPEIRNADLSRAAQMDIQRMNEAGANSRAAMNESGANSRNAADIALRRDIADMEYGYKEKAAEQKTAGEAKKQVIGQYNFLVKNILPEEKTMLFDSAEDLDALGAQSIVEKLNKKVADPDPGISARARKALSLFESIAPVSGSFTNNDDWEEVTDPNILNQIKFR
jgi:hypothetical protein